jgi:hypothetical protein
VNQCPTTYTIMCCKAFSMLTSANILSLLCGFNPFQVYRDSEVIPMVCCDVCEKWVHIECDGIRSVQASNLHSVSVITFIFLAYSVSTVSCLYTSVLPSLYFLFGDLFMQ